MIRVSMDVSGWSGGWGSLQDALDDWAEQHRITLKAVEISGGLPDSEELDEMGDWEGGDA